MIKNAEIRSMIMLSGLKNYEVAAALNMQDSNFSRLLREELPEDKKEAIIEAINSLKGASADAV